MSTTLFICNDLPLINKSFVIRHNNYAVTNIGITSVFITNIISKNKVPASKRERDRELIVKIIHKRGLITFYSSRILFCLKLSIGETIYRLTSDYKWYWFHVKYFRITKCDNWLSRMISIGIFENRVNEISLRNSVSEKIHIRRYLSILSINWLICVSLCIKFKTSSCAILYFITDKFRIVN